MIQSAPGDPLATPTSALPSTPEASAASDRLAASARASTNAGDVRPTPSSGSPAGATTRAAVEAEVLDTLARYRTAYEQLDAAAVASVWAAVDQRALARAFAGLRSQRIEFDRCDVSASETAATAVATCTGRATYVPAIGRSDPQSQARRWQFTLRRTPDGWRIERADIRE